MTVRNVTTPAVRRGRGRAVRQSLEPGHPPFTRDRKEQTDVVLDGCWHICRGRTGPVCSKTMVFSHMAAVDMPCAASICCAFQQLKQSERSGRHSAIKRALLALQLCDEKLCDGRQHSTAEAAQYMYQR